MATGKQLEAAILARRAAKGPRKKRTRPEPRQYTVADLERARDRVIPTAPNIDSLRDSQIRESLTRCWLLKEEQHRWVQRLRSDGLI
jgi:hypothetical protein